MRKPQPTAIPRRQTAFTLEALEPRVLFSADAVALFGGASYDVFTDAHSEQQPAPWQQTVQNAATNASAANDAQNTSVELIIIDRAVDDADWVAEQLRDEQRDDRVVVLLNSDEDGVDQISAILAEHSNVSAIHLFSHGSDAELQLGNTTVELGDLMTRAAQISGWADSLEANADILLYGCDLTSSADGIEFTTFLGQLTRADIAASDNLTGNNAKGGDWSLERSIGTIEADTDMAGELLNDYTGVLTIFEVTNGNDSGSGSLREAIMDLNAAAHGVTHQIKINFQFGAPAEISLQSALPTITKTVHLSHDNFGNVSLDGANAGPNVNGLSFGPGSDDSTISQMSIHSFSGSGIFAMDVTNLSISENRIGLAGTSSNTSAPNAGNGIHLINVSGSTIGGSNSPSDENVIVGSGMNGIVIDGSASDNNEISNNLIGVTPFFGPPQGNNDAGILLSGGANNTVVIQNAITGNIVNGIEITDSSSSNYLLFNTINENGADGIRITGSSSDHIIQGNEIGVSSTGGNTSGNGGSGISLNSGVTDTVIGEGARNLPGFSVQPENTIVGSGTHGVLITGVGTSGNSVAGNVIGSTSQFNTKSNGITSDVINAGIQYGGITLSNGATNTTIGGADDTFQNVVSGNEEVGILIEGATTTANIISANAIGTNANGSQRVANGQHGVLIRDGANNNTIGGNTADLANIISGNQGSGIVLTSNNTDNNLVLGNYIGTNFDGDSGLANNSHGIEISNQASSNIIGGDRTLGNANVISGNNGAGISISSSDSDANQVFGNTIGLHPNASQALGNFGNGIQVLGGNANVIGSTDYGHFNVISANTGDGVLVSGAVSTNTTIGINIIGTDLLGTVDLGNGGNGITVTDDADNTTIAFNIISGNTGEGILVTGTGTSNTHINENTIGLSSNDLIAFGNDLNGVSVENGAQSTRIHENVISGNEEYGVVVTGESTQGTVISANHIGTNIAGDSAVGNALGGIHLTGDSKNTLIGGLPATDGNLISGNGSNTTGSSGHGIDIDLSSTNNTLEGNMIGLSLSGLSALANTGSGIHVASTGNVIGGSSSNARNVIAGNKQHGIWIVSGANNTAVIGNHIGIDNGGPNSVGNTLNGIHIESIGNVIGGTSSAAGNVISHNKEAGIRITGSGATDNSLLGNSIYSNDGLAIDVDVAGVTANDLNDIDSGANRVQNFPIITSVATDGTSTIMINGTLNSEANKTYRLEFFANSASTGNAKSEAERLIASASVSTDASGNANFSITESIAVSSSEFIASTATLDLGPGGYSDTSELSASVLAGNANNAPSFTTPTSYSVNENTTAVATLNANDTDGDNLDYSLIGTDDDAHFEVDSLTGALGFTLSPDVENPSDSDLDNQYIVTVKVEDESGAFDTHTLTITVVDLDDTAPVIPDGQTFDVDENASDASTAGTVAATDPDTAGSLQWSIAAGNTDGAFSIDASTGEISVAQSTAIDHENSAQFILSVTVTDGTNAPAAENVTINVVDINEPLSPLVDTDTNEGLSSAQGSVNENTSVGTSVGIHVDTTDEDDGQTVSYALSGADAALFTIDSDGVVTTNARLNHEESAERSFTITATSSDLSSASRNFTVSVIDVNDTPVFTTGSTLPGATEDTPYSATISAEDEDEGSTISLSVVSKPDWLNVTDNGDGTATLFGTPTNSDVGATNSLRLKLTTSGNPTGGSNLVSRSITFTMEVINTNETPQFTSSETSFSVNENSTEVTTFDATDDDNDTLSYSLTGADANLFSIDNAGNLAFVTAPDFDAPTDANTNNVYELTLRVNDNTGAPNAIVTRAITVIVTDQNDKAPVISTGQAFNIDESALNASSVGTVASIDPDTVGSLTWRITDGNDSGAFAIDSVTGEIVIADSALIDHETTPTYNLTINVSDGVNTPFAQNIIININDVPEDLNPITDIDNTGAPGTDGLVNENATSGTAVGIHVNTIDQDDNQSISYTLSGADAALFSINTDGIITTSAVLDHEAIRTFTVTALSTDGSTDTRIFSVSVIDINEAPVFITGNILPDATEDALYTKTISASDFDASDTGDTLTISVLAKPDWLSVTDNMDGTATLSGTPGNNDIGPNAVVLQIRDTTGLVSNRTFTLAVINTNDTPVIVTTHNTFDVSENSSFVSSFSATDVDADTLTYSLTGTDAALFSINHTGNLSFNTAADFEAPTDSGADNTYNLQVRASDNSGTPNAIVTKQIAVTVTDLNDSNPVISAGQSFSINEGANNNTLVGTVNASDPDTVGSLTWSIVSGDSAGAFSISSATGEILVSDNSPIDHETTAAYALIVSASDGENIPSTQTVNITVLDIADEELAPITDIDTAAGVSGAEGSVNENVEIGTTVGIQLNTIDGDAGQSIRYSLNGTDASLFSIDANGVITTATAIDFESGSSRAFTVTADSSDGSSATRNVSVSIVDVNETPAFSSAVNNAFTTLENTNAIGKVGATDEDGDTLTYSLSGTDAALFSIDNQGNLSFATPADFEAPADSGTDNVYNLIVQVSENIGATSQLVTRAITVTITDVNDTAPVIRAEQILSVNENPDGGSSVGMVALVDVDTAGALTWSIAGGNRTGAFSINAATGEITVANASVIDYESIQSMNLRVQVTDGVHPTSTSSVLIDINNVNEAPILNSTRINSIESFSGVIGILDIVDEDAGDIVQLSIVGGTAQSNFSYSSDTNELSQLAQMAAGTYTLDVRLMDSEGNFTDATLSIAILSDPELASALPDIPDEQQSISSNGTSQSAVSFPSEVLSVGDTLMNKDSTAELAESDVASDSATEDEPDTSAEVVAGEQFWNTIIPQSDDNQLNIVDDDSVDRTITQNANFQVIQNDRIRLIELLEQLDVDASIISISGLEGFELSRFLLTLSPFNSSYTSSQLEQELDEVAQQNKQQYELSLTVGSGAVVVLTAGFVVWLLQAGVLLSAASTSAPLWRKFDPIPVLLGQTQGDNSGG